MLLPANYTINQQGRGWSGRAREEQALPLCSQEGCMQEAGRPLQQKAEITGVQVPVIIFLGPVLLAAETLKECVESTIEERAAYFWDKEHLAKVGPCWSHKSRSWPAPGPHWVPWYKGLSTSTGASWELQALWHQALWGHSSSKFKAVPGQPCCWACLWWMGCLFLPHHLPPCLFTSKTQLRYLCFELQKKKKETRDPSECFSESRDVTFLGVSFLTSPNPAMVILIWARGQGLMLLLQPPKVWPFFTIFPPSGSGTTSIFGRIEGLGTSNVHL